MVGYLRNVTFGIVVITLGACAAGEGDTADERTVLISACETQQGIGWLRKEYGEDYCACWADAAKDGLDQATYAELVKASRAELKAENETERENLARAAFGANAQAADAARMACRK